MFELTTKMKNDEGYSKKIGRNMNLYHMNEPFELLQINTMEYSPGEYLCVYQNSLDRIFYGIYDAFDFQRGYEANELKTGELHADLHSHDYYEFLFILDGEMYQNIEHHRHFYPKGGCCLVCPDTMHSEEYTTKSRVLFFKITKEYLHELLSRPRFFPGEKNNSLKRAIEFLDTQNRYIDFIPAFGYEWVCENIHKIFEKMTYIFNFPTNDATFEMDVLINKLLMELFDSEKFGNTPISYGSESEQKLFDEIKEYMTNANGKVKRSDLEKHFSYSGDYLYKVVKNQTGLSLYHYNMYICMKKAAHLLLSTNMNINDIAEEVGFHNYTHFYNVFKQNYGMTPREFRAREG